MRTAKTAPHAKRDDCPLVRQKIGHELSLARKKETAGHSIAFALFPFLLVFGDNVSLFTRASGICVFRKAFIFNFA